MVPLIRHSIFLLVACCLYTLAVAQPRTQNSELPPSTEATTSFRSAQRDIMPQLDSANALAGTRPNEAYDIVERALSISIADRNKLGEAQCYHILGIINYHLQQHELAISNFEKSKAINTQLREEDGLYQNTLWMGRTREAQGLNDRALIHYLALHEKARASNRQQDLITTKNLIAEVYLKQGKKELANDWFTDVLELQKARGDEQGIFDANENLGRVYEEQQQIEQALNVYQSNYTQAMNSNSTDMRNRGYKSLGKALRKKGDRDNELQIRQQSIEFNTSIDNQKEVSLQSWEIGNIYLSEGNSIEAIPYYENSVEISEGLGDLEQQAEAMQTLSKAYEEAGDPTRALEVYKDAMLLVDSVSALREAEVTQMLALNGEVAQKQQRIELLERERELSDKTIDLLRQEQELRDESMWWQRIIIVTLSIFFIGALIAGYLIYSNARQKRIANQLLALKSLRSQMNPHFIFNALNSVNSFIAKNDERSANRYLSDFSRLMRAVMENSQEDFVPLSSELQILDLYLQLEHFRFKDKFDYTFEVADDIDRDAFQVPPMIVQPYLENAVWHGLRYKEEKGNLTVKVAQDGDRLHVLIEDDGIGRKKSQELKTKNQRANRSTGLRNIESRIRIINDMHKTNMEVAIDDLDPATQTGTRVQIWLPNRSEEV